MGSNNPIWESTRAKYKYIISDTPLTIYIASAFIICMSAVSQLFEIKSLSILFGSLFLTIVPGLITFSAIQTNIFRWVTLPYVISISLAEIMVLGFLGSVISIRYGLPGPFTRSGSILFFHVPVAIHIVVFKYVLSGKNLFWRRNKISTENVSVRLLLIHVLVLFSILSGTQLLNISGNNRLLVSAIFAISLLPVVVLYSTDNKTDYVLSAWLIGLSVLLQNTLININLAAGDGRFERAYGAVSLLLGHYDLSLSTIRATSLRISVLNPAFSTLTGLDLEIAATIFHPISLSVLIIAVFVLYDSYFDHRTAYIGSILLVFSAPWLNTMSRTTRTATALLFVVVSILAVTQNNPEKYRLIFLISLLGIPASHYGIGPIFLIFLFVLWVGWMIIGVRDPFNVGFINYIVLYGVFIVVWMMFLADGSGFTFIVRSVAETVTSILLEGSGTSQAATGASIPMPSFTYAFIKIEYLVVLLLSTIGLSLASIRSFNYYPSKIIPNSVLSISDRYSPEPHHYLAVGFAALSMLSLAVVPAVGMGIPRLYIFSMLFLAPFAILTATHAVDVVMSVFGPAIDPYKVVSLILAIVLLINSGVAAATLTHNNSPQPYLVRPDQAEEPTESSLFQFYRVYISDKGLQSSDWLDQHAHSQLVYGSALQAPLRSDNVNNAVPLEKGNEIVNTSADMCDGYLRIGPADYDLEKMVTTRYPDWVYFRDNWVSIESVRGEERNLIYNSGNLTMYDRCR